MRGGDAAALEVFVRRMACVRLILAVQNARVGRMLAPSQFDDVTHETLALVWRRPDTFEGRLTLETWVYRFCLNTPMNALRREQRARRREELSDQTADPARLDAQSRYTRYDSLYLALSASRRVRCARARRYRGPGPRAGRPGTRRPAWLGAPPTPRA